MLLTEGRSSRLRRLGLTFLALVLMAAGMAWLSPAPVQAGEAQPNGILDAAIYNDSPFPLQYVESWSQYGFPVAPTDVPVEGGRPFNIKGSDTKTGGFPCGWQSNTYNGWFTYKVTVPYDGGATEYFTISIRGERLQSYNGNCLGGYEPGLDVWQTSTPPPSTWRWTQGAPPNLLAAPQFSYTHNDPYLFDQTIRWNGEGPGKGVQSVVSLGDSTISGEGGRWAGNTNMNDGRDDAGSTSYWDTTSGESITDCHRSKSALVHIGPPFRTQNFACSGAETFSYDWQYPQGWRFKPGVDLVCGQQVGVLDCPGGRMGQLNQLYHYARTHNVTHVVVAVGANDFDFSGIVKKCMTIYMEQHFWDSGKRCYNSGVIQTAISASNRQKLANDIYESLNDVTTTMGKAGYTPGMYDVIVQNYWSAIPSDEDIRIPDTDYRRQLEGGCPLLYGDASALNEYLLPAINQTVLAAAMRLRSQPSMPAIRFMDVSDALKGHRLCEKGVGLIEDIPSFYGKGTDPKAADKVEWVTEARTASVIGTDYTLAEGGHANYWGQLAERNCMRQLIYTPAFRGGKCVPATGGGVNSRGEPNMTLSPLQW
jgi:hypothetical protein